MLRVGVQVSSWYNKEDPEGSFAFIRSCGFEAVDFNINAYAPLRAKEPIPETIFDKSEEEVLAFFANMKAAAEHQGIHISQMHAPIPVLFPERPDLTDYAIMVTEKCMAVCADVGCPAIVVHPDRDLDKEKEFETNLALYRRLIPAAKRTGVKVCLENLPRHQNGRLTDGVCNSGEEVCRYVDTLNAEAGCDAFGYCFDVGHASLAGNNMREHLKGLGDRLTVLHIHDNDGLTDWHTAPYTCVAPSGLRTDWEGFIEGLRLCGYRGDLSFETFRVLRYLPQPLHADMLRYIAATGRYFRSRILGEESAP